MPSPREGGGVLSIWSFPVRSNTLSKSTFGKPAANAPAARGSLQVPPHHGSTSTRPAVKEKEQRERSRELVYCWDSIVFMSGSSIYIIIYIYREMPGVSQHSFVQAWLDPIGFLPEPVGEGWLMLGRWHVYLPPHTRCMHRSLL